jgi:hypothetical protein
MISSCKRSTTSRISVKNSNLTMRLTIPLRRECNSGRASSHPHEAEFLTVYREVLKQSAAELFAPAPLLSRAGGRVFWSSDRGCDRAIPNGSRLVRERRYRSIGVLGARNNQTLNRPLCCSKAKIVRGLGIRFSCGTGVVSPMAGQALSARGVNVTTKALPGPLQ